MKKILTLTALFIILQGCTQKNKTMITQNPAITANNIVDELAKQVKHYPKEPTFLINYERSWCFMEIFVNDMLVYKEFDESMSSTSFEISNYIFKSGTQKISYKLYPIGKLKSETDIYNSLIDNTLLKIEIEEFDVSKSRNPEGKIVKEFTSPMSITKDEYGNETEKFIATGKDYYEGSLTFEAKIPYELEGFENAQDLRKLDAKILERKLVKQYAALRDIYQNKEYDNIAKTSYNSLRDQFIAEYQTKENIQSIWEELIGAFKEPSFEMQPIENYKLVFFAEGKLVALMQTTQDNRLRGNTALWAKVNHDGGLRPMFLNSYFYIPQGETEFKVY
ncbi:hypothetical protein [Flavobacterium sp. PL002]|uniref:hypothetical protein n=1 Tax=Flavobacterium sp. PL002 TaxID=1897058 RepID=UPI001787F497|nr:hypothetical protein [Flavobacterium sp. PL002]MBE0390787.1 hypothetical protein [Flavobacterium sp. PL002]